MNKKREPPGSKCRDQSARSFRFVMGVTSDEKELLNALGGAHWIREVIDEVVPVRGMKLKTQFGPPGPDMTHLHSILQHNAEGWLYQSLLMLSLRLDKVRPEDRNNALEALWSTVRQFVPPHRWQEQFINSVPEDNGFARRLPPELVAEPAESEGNQSPLDSQTKNLFDDGIDQFPKGTGISRRERK